MNLDPLHLDGQETLASAPVARFPLFRDAYIQSSRVYHLAGVGAFAALGLLSMIRIEILLDVIKLLSIVVGFYFFALVFKRGFDLRRATRAQVGLIILDLTEIFLINLALSFVSGFWFGFANAALSSGRSDVLDTHIVGVVTATSGCCYAFLFILVSACVYITKAHGDALTAAVPDESMGQDVPRPWSGMR